MNGLSTNDKNWDKGAEGEKALGEKLFEDCICTHPLCYITFAKFFFNATIFHYLDGNMQGYEHRLVDHMPVNGTLAGIIFVKLPLFFGNLVSFFFHLCLVAHYLNQHARFKYIDFQAKSQQARVVADEQLLISTDTLLCYYLKQIILV